MQRKPIGGNPQRPLPLLSAALLTFALGSGPMVFPLDAQVVDNAPIGFTGQDIGLQSGQGQTSIVGLGIPESAIPGKTWVEGGAAIIAISDDGKQIFGYSEQHPSWAAQSLESMPGVKAIPVVSQELAAVQYGNVCYAFNPSRGTWRALKLPAGEVAVPILGNDSVIVRSPSQGDHVFKSSWNAWFSAEEIKAGKVTEFLASQSVESPTSEKRESAMTIKVFPLRFVKAASAANMLRQLYGNASSIAVEERTNELIVRCDTEVLKELEALLTEMDREDPAISTSDVKSSSPSAESSFLFSLGSTDESVSELKRRFLEQEKIAKDLAIDIRKRALPDGSTPEIHRQSLRSAVQQAFETKQNLQRAELSEFARRLQSIQQSIEMRDRVGKQIVDRRVEELLDPNLSWEKPADTTDAIAENDSMAPSSIATPERRSQAPSQNVQFSFNATQLGKPQWLSGQGGMTIVGRGEGSINTSLGSSLLLRLIRHPGNEEAAVFLYLEIPDVSAIESSSNGFVEPLEILSHNAIPLFVYGEDFDEVQSGKLVTKAIYIPRNLTGGSGSSLFNRVDSWRLEPAADPVKMAAESGTVVAILRLSTRVESFSNDAAD